jgi:peptidoglycan/xylan/chitin deacetylase (PgdA/CDA1 family)
MTELPTHGRYDYSAIRDRAVYDWPGGKRLAVYLAINLEHFAFGEGLGAELAPGGPQPDVLNYAWRDWGNRVGVWRLIHMFDDLGMPTSVLVNSGIYGHCPSVMDAFRARGDEVVAHGRTNAERQGVLDRQAEARLIAETTQTIEAAEGRRPRGWLGPWISESHVTPDLLAEAGYHYLLDWCMDDQPVWMRAGAGRILSVPYPQELNDIPAIVARKDSPAQFADSIVDAFDEMREQSLAAPLVMGIALHPYIIAHPHRLRPLRRALSHIAESRDDIWITTAGAVAEHVAALPKGTVPGDA